MSEHNNQDTQNVTKVASTEKSESTTKVVKNEANQDSAPQEVDPFDFESEKKTNDDSENRINNLQSQIKTLQQENT